MSYGNVDVPLQYKNKPAGTITLNIIGNTN